jgi:hypothetical protein
MNNPNIELREILLKAREIQKRKFVKGGKSGERNTKKHQSSSYGSVGCLPSVRAVYLRFLSCFVQSWWGEILIGLLHELYFDKFIQLLEECLLL